jgi:hypothetical protein
MEKEDASETSVTIHRHCGVITHKSAPTLCVCLLLITTDSVTGLREILPSGCPHAARHCHSYGCKRQVAVIAENDMMIRNGHSQVSMKPLKKRGRQTTLINTRLRS